MKSAIALLFLALLPASYAGSLETLNGKLEQESGKYVLSLKDAYKLEFGGQSISSKRLQVEGWTVADIPKLDAAKGKQIKLTGYIYPGTPSHVEKLVISVTSVPGDGPLVQTVIVNAPTVASPIPDESQTEDNYIPHPPFPKESPTPIPTQPQPDPSQTPPIRDLTKLLPDLQSPDQPSPDQSSSTPTQNSIIGSWITDNGDHDYSNVIILQFCDDYTGRIVNKPSGSRVSPKAYRFKWAVYKNAIWVNLLDGRTSLSGSDRGNWDIISISPSTITLDLGDETRAFKKAE